MTHFKSLSAEQLIYLKTQQLTKWNTFKLSVRTDHFERELNEGGE